MQVTLSCSEFFSNFKESSTTQCEKNKCKKTHTISTANHRQYNEYFHGNYWNNLLTSHLLFHGVRFSHMVPHIDFHGQPLEEFWYLELLSLTISHDTSWDDHIVEVISYNEQHAREAGRGRGVPRLLLICVRTGKERTAQTWPICRQE